MKALIPIMAATAALTFAGTPAGPASGSAIEASSHTIRHRRAEVTTGRFHTLPGGVDLGYDVRGRAIMIRFGRIDQTAVVVGVKGLDPDTSYPAHVHNLPCSATPPGGSHYQHDVGGAVDAVNEMWPTITTRRHGSGVGHAWHEHLARADARSIVVHYPPNTAIRLACADLT